MTNSINMTVQQARALANLAPKNEVRYYLNGVCLDFEAMRAVVTDGHKLLALNCSGASDGPLQVIVPREELRKFAVGGKRDAVITITAGEMETDDVTLYRDDTGSTATAKPIYGRFPDYTRVMPEPSGEPAHFNPQYVAELDKALLDCCAPGKAYHAAVIPNGNGAATVFLHGWEHQAIGVVMPLRQNVPDDIGAPIRDFFARDDGKAKAA